MNTKYLMCMYLPSTILLWIWWQFEHGSRNMFSTRPSCPFPTNWPASLQCQSDLYDNVELVALVICCFGGDYDGCEVEVEVDCAVKKMGRRCSTVTGPAVASSSMPTIEKYIYILITFIYDINTAEMEHTKQSTRDVQCNTRHICCNLMRHLQAIN